MQSRAGFTLIELMVVAAILGIIGATAVPLYRTYQQRAYGSQAALMVRQLLDAEIMHFLEHDKFFPTPNYSGDNPIFIPSGASSNDPVTKDIFSALNVTIPVSHVLDYHLVADNTSGAELFTVTVQANFPLFKGQTGGGTIIGSVSKDGGITVIVP